jgi:hypothetical protein
LLKLISIMLAAHRDQENLAHSHQVPTKQHPKTPGARYPKTPSRFGQNDENAPAAFAGKNTIAGGARTGGHDKIMVKTNGNRQAMVTPLGKLEECLVFLHVANFEFFSVDNRARAPLGNKTTNAKAKGVQTGGVKDIVKQIEKSQSKAPNTERPKPKQFNAPPQLIEVQKDRIEPTEENEPEYAPPRPVDLPYESDLVPKGGLTFEGLKHENMFQGFYEHFYDPVDQNGVSRTERRFKSEMRSVMDKALERNERDLEGFDWGIPDATETKPKALQQKTNRPEASEKTTANKAKVRAERNAPASITSRKAASALAIHSDVKKPVALKTPTPTRRPLSSLIHRPGVGRPVKSTPRVDSSGNAMGEVASRTTIGYSKGKSASSMIHKPSQSKTLVRDQGKKPVAQLDEDTAELTITPARARQAASDSNIKSDTQMRPQFVSIFDNAEEEDDLPPMTEPILEGVEEEEEEEEFQLNMDI